MDSDGKASPASANVQRQAVQRQEHKAADYDRIHGIIHAASLGAGGLGAGLAQLPFADMPALMALQILMVTKIAKEHGVDLSDSLAEALIGNLAARTLGVTIARQLVGWIPGFGNAIKGTTAFGMTEALGWAADAYFRKGAEQCS